MTKTKKAVAEAFEIINGIIGTMSGGVEAPRILLSIKPGEGGTVEVTWRNPETCGLSDVRYHYTDLEPHTDLYTFRKGKLLVNGQDPFADLWFEENRKEVERFYQKYGLGI